MEIISYDIPELAAALLPVENPPEEEVPENQPEEEVLENHQLVEVMEHNTPDEEEENQVVVPAACLRCSLCRKHLDFNNPSHARLIVFFEFESVLLLLVHCLLLSCLSGMIRLADSILPQVQRLKNLDNQLENLCARLRRMQEVMSQMRQGELARWSKVDGHFFSSHPQNSPARTCYIRSCYHWHIIYRRAFWETMDKDVVRKTKS
ncbi:hypothetical protein L484_002164 [Morus notabilis]|uniref:Uncharacterized protein n=1 Tax=Morus notabilis TaxID=981085 RepID=W9SAU6_9ROSA|nr:hypothetical protein L484_002164 [Morus notabilis]